MCVRLMRAGVCKVGVGMCSTGSLEVLGELY